jgi:ketosteroid isomerase-like protein
MPPASFAEAVERNHRAIEAFMAGDTQPWKDLFAHRDDVTLANPFGGIAVGWEEVSQRLERAASYYSDGEVVGVEAISEVASADLGYTVEIEQVRGRVAGAADPATIALRVSSVYRLEEGAWWLVHRHADPRVKVVAPESILE